MLFVKAYRSQCPFSRRFNTYLHEDFFRVRSDREWLYFHYYMTILFSFSERKHL